MHKARTFGGLALAVALVFALVALTGCAQGPATSSSTTGSSTSAPASATPSYNLVTPAQITVGSDTTFPPFESMKGTTAEGFDVDLMNAIGKELGIKVVFQTEQFDTIFASLAGHKFDVVASASSIKPERVKIVAPSEPYFDSNQSIAVLKSSGITTTSALYSKKIGVQSGTTGSDWATENLKPKGAKIVPFKDATGAFNALQAGTVDAVVNDLPVTSEIIRQGPTRGFVIIAKVGTAEQYVLWTAKDNPDLLKDMNAALAKLKANGEFQKIYDKWIPSGTN
jgi:polar amino acid transport system substrate-binding protein